jgi:hypothetical protein
VCIINLDPANDALPYECAIDMRELVSLSDVMERLALGPNGGLIYCMEYLEQNMDWLHEKLQQFKEHYLLFDTPGQAELYTNHTSMRRIVDHIQRWGVRLCGLHLIDSYYCSVPSTYISAVLLSLSTMLHLELPHINVLSKIDLVEKYGKLAFDLEFFADVGDLEYLLDRLDADPFGKKFGNLNKALCSLIDDYSLVSFTTLNIQDKESVYNLVKMIDKTNGYVYGSFIPGNDSIMTLMESSATTWQFDKFAAVQERYIANDDDDDDDEDEADHDDNDDIEREEGDVDVVAASSQRSQQEEEEAPPPATMSKGKEKS